MVVQGLCKSAIAIVYRLHVSTNSCIFSSPTGDRDIRSPLVKFPPSDLDAAVIQREGPLTLETVSNASSEAYAAVVPDVVAMRVEQRLIKNE